MAIGMKPKSPADNGSTMSDDDDTMGGDGPDGDNDADDQNEDGEPEISLPPGYMPPDDAKPGEEIPFLGKLKIGPDGKTATICSIDGAPYAQGDEDSGTESDNSEMQLDNQTPNPDEEQSAAPPEDMNNGAGALSDRVKQLRMKIKAKM